MNKVKHIILVIIIGNFTLTNAQNTKWNADPSHSSIGFSIDHLVVSETTGEFNEYSMNVIADADDFSDAKFDVIIQVAGIDTKDEKRDTHLRSADFFDVEKFSTITFIGKKFKRVKGDEYKVVGDITMHGVTKTIELDAKFGGIVKDPWGGTRAGLKVWGEIDRYDFGLRYNSLLEAGGLSIGQMVRIECRLELIKESVGN